MSQEAELRVVLHNNGQYLLLHYAQLKSFELVQGPPSKALKGMPEEKRLRGVWHQNGSFNMHTPVGVQSRQRVKLQHFQGKALIGGVGASGLVSWDYHPKKDSKIRRTLIVDTTDRSPAGCATQLWAVEQGRDDLIDEIVNPTGYTSRMVEVIGYIRAEWTQPQLVALLQTLTSQAHAVLEHSTGRTINAPKLTKI